jgi:flagellar hook-associated protein 2
MSAANSLRLERTFNNMVSTSVTAINGANSTPSSDITVRNIESNLVGDLKMTVFKTATQDIYTGTSRQTIQGATTTTPLAVNDRFNITLNGETKEIIWSAVDQANLANLTAAPSNLSYGDALVSVMNGKLVNEFGYNYKLEGGVAVIDDTAQRVSIGFTGGRFEFTALEGNKLSISNATPPANDALNKLGFGTTGRSTGFGGNYSGSINSIQINGTTIDGIAGQSLDSIVNKINNSAAGVTISFDSNLQIYRMSSNGTGESSNINLNPNAASLLNSAFGLSAANRTAATNATVSFNNGAQITQESNTFTHEGLQITLNANSAGQEFNINVSRNVEPMMNIMRQFVEDYNSLVQMLHDLTTTPRPRSDKFTFYDPLTEDQKKELSEREIDLWENKAKTGLLHRDDIISRIQSQLREMIYNPVINARNANGEKISLFDIGITTSGANGNIGLLQIHEEKLRSALESNPAGVRDLFIANDFNIDTNSVEGRSRSMRSINSGLASRLDSIIGNALEHGGSIRTRAGIEGTASVRDNAMEYEMKEFERRIADMMVQLARKEHSYFMMFSRMENALAQSNRQMDSMMSMMMGGF